jgi:hypothetical protein
MTIGLLTLNLLSLIALGVTAFHGHQIPQGGGALGRHLFMALAATLLAVFAQTMTLFYFIGVSSTIKKSVAADRPGKELLSSSQGLKARVTAWAAAAIALLMITFILGGAAHTRLLPGWAHGGLGYLSLALTGLAVALETRLLLRQNFLLNEFNRRWAEREAG